jgi:hypothetical protein
MSPEVAAWIERERCCVEAFIRESFGGVSREGGVSWRESIVLDVGSEVERVKKLGRDREASWDALIDDPKWIPDWGVGGFIFLDPIGTRYYIAPAMIRACRGENPAAVSFALGVCPISMDKSRLFEKFSLLTQAQGHAVYRFLVFMLLFDMARGYESGSGQVEWIDCLAHYWGQFADELPTLAASPQG